MTPDGGECAILVVLRSRDEGGDAWDAMVACLVYVAIGVQRMLVRPRHAGTGPMKISYLRLYLGAIFAITPRLPQHNQVMFKAMLT